MPESFGVKPLPAATNPSRPIERGTIANKSAPRVNALRILFSWMENARCQKHWSPNGPANNPIAVGIPNPRRTCIPLSLNKLVKSPVTPVIPLANAWVFPGMESAQGIRMAQTASIIIIWTASVITEALIPENWE